MAALVLALGFLTACGGGRPAPGAVARADTLTAAIRSVEPGERSLQVITGTGLALRVVEFRVPAGTPIFYYGRETDLAGLRPGYVVHVEYRDTGSGPVAERIVEGPEGAEPESGPP